MAKKSTLDRWKKSKSRKDMNNAVSTDVVQAAPESVTNPMELEFPEIEKELKPIDDAIGDLILKMNSEHGVTIEDDEPLSSEDQERLKECHRLLAYISRSLIATSVVAYQIEVKKLWRGSGYKNAVEYMKNFFNMQYSTIRRYAQTGRVVVVINQRYPLKELPNSLDAFIPFSKLEDKDSIIASYEEAVEKSENGKVSKKIAKEVVSEKLGVQPNSKVKKVNQSHKEKTAILKPLKRVRALFEVYSQKHKTTFGSSDLIKEMKALIDIYDNWANEEK